MAEEQQASRRRRSQNHAATPERVSQAAVQMRAEAETRAARMNPSNPDSFPRQGAVPEYPPFYGNMPDLGGAYPPQQGGWPNQGVPYGGQGVPYGGADYDYAAQQQYAAQQYAAQQYAARQYAAQQEAEAEMRLQAQQTAERKRISEETSSRGAFRGYSTGPIPVAGRDNGGDDPRKEKKPAGRKGRHTAAVIFFILLAAALLAGGALWGVSQYEYRQKEEAVRAYDGLFCEGVYVDGISLGGMTAEQGMNSVSSRIQERNAAWSVQLTYRGETVAEINANMLGMSVDVRDIMNAAWSQGKTGTIEERYEAMQALKETPFTAYTAQPSGDTSVIDSMLESLKSRIDKPARDASMDGFDPSQPYPFLFTEEEAGLRLDTDAVREELYRMVATMTGGSVELTPETVEPQVRKTDLQSHYMLRSSVYTQISTSSPDERNKNIARALEAVNGYVLPAGAQFSFNGVVGERTEANGFLPAIEYAYGEHVMGIGGGVCQASTTLYQAAVCAGLTIVKREPHSDAVNYTEYGKDATVYWVGRRKIDLVFRNSSDGPIYMVASVQQDPGNKRRLIAKVSMYGEDMGDVRYEIEAVKVQDLDPPEKPQYIKDTNATYVTYTDQQQSVSKAKPGCVVESYRVEYVGNVVNDRVFLYKDVYEPQAEKIYVGVKKRDQK